MSFLASGDSSSKMCDICGKQFVGPNRKQNRQRHINGVHFNLRPYSCPFCYKTYQQVGHMNSHIRTLHSEKVMNVKSMMHLDIGTFKQWSQIDLLGNRKHIYHLIDYFIEWLGQVESSHITVATWEVNWKNGKQKMCNAMIA